MNKKCYRFFGGLITAQEKWLNKMAEMGYRLIRTKKMQYEFQECTPKLVEYRMDFIGQKSQIKAQDYHNFLEEMGYKVFYKNINLNYSIGNIFHLVNVSIGTSRHITDIAVRPCC